MIDRIYSQYRNKPKAVDFFEIVPSISEQISTAYNQICNTYNIDEMFKANLDVIGRIVVLSRSYERTAVSGQPEYGGLDDQHGGTQIQYGTTIATIKDDLSDAMYKLLLKSKIAKNNRTTSIDDTARAIEFIFSDPEPRVINNYNMSFNIVFSKTLTDLDRFVLAYLDPIPTPQGVRMSGYLEGITEAQYGDIEYGDPNVQCGQFT